MNEVILSSDPKLSWEDLEEMVGKTIYSITGLKKDSEEVVFEMTNGEKHIFFHEVTCCEDVSLDDFVGYPDDLIGAVILSSGIAYGEQIELEDGSETWSFYKIETNKGGLTMRWYGKSNGYYSEKVEYMVTEPEFKDVTSVELDRVPPPPKLLH